MEYDNNFNFDNYLIDSGYETSPKENEVVATKGCVDIYFVQVDRYSGHPKEMTILWDKKTVYKGLMPCNKEYADMLFVLLFPEKEVIDNIESEISSNLYK